MRIVELITDPASGQLSMSRTLLPVVVALDVGWVVTAAIGLPPQPSVAPISSMVGIVTGAICGVYGLSTMKRNPGEIGRQVFNRARTIFKKAG